MLVSGYGWSLGLCHLSGECFESGVSSWLGLVSSVLGISVTGWIVDFGFVFFAHVMAGPQSTYPKP